MKKINQRLVEKINEATEGRDYDIQLKNIVYFLINNYKAAKTTHLDDYEILTIADNQFVNNELITADNLEEYNDYLLKIKTRKSLIEAIKKGEKILLLNYYDYKGEFHDCHIVLDSNYNVF